jgi:mannose-6-phosphate isomerase-like protein (cupin superfamily)
MQTLGATEGDRADFPSLGTRYLLRGDATDGRFALIEHEIPPRSLAAPTHTHTNEDEYSFVLSGRVGVQVGDDVTEAGPGDFVAKPRGVPHAFWNAGEEPARLLELISPAGFERYFEELAPHLQAAGPPDLDALGAIRERYSLTMDMDSIGSLVERHGLRPR